MGYSQVLPKVNNEFGSVPAAVRMAARSAPAGDCLVPGFDQLLAEYYRKILAASVGIFEERINSHNPLIINFLLQSMLALQEPLS